MTINIIKTIEVTDFPDWLKETDYQTIQRRDEPLWFHKQTGQISTNPEGKGWSLMVEVRENESEHAKG